MNSKSTEEIGEAVVHRMCLKAGRLAVCAWVFRTRLYLLREMVSYTLVKSRFLISL